MKRGCKNSLLDSYLKVKLLILSVSISNSLDRDEISLVDLATISVSSSDIAAVSSVEAALLLEISFNCSRLTKIVSLFSLTICIC